MLYAKQSTAIIITVGPVLDASGVAVTTSVVGDFLISKNGGAPAALNGSATLTHRNTGNYSLSLTATDVNTVGTVEIVINATTNACPIKEVQVVETTIYDALFADTANGFSGAVGASTVTFANTTIGTVTTVTNQLTAAQVATGVWQDATAGDFTVASSIGKSLYTTGNAPGAASGLALVGSNMGTVSSVTGNVGGNVVGSVASVTARVTANTDQLAGQTVTAGAGVTFPSSVASPTNITAGTITTVTNLTNAATAGDFTATMKTSIGTAVAASAVASVTGNVSGNVVGSVGSIASGGITTASFAAGAINAAAVADGAIDRATFAVDTGLQTVRSGTAQAGAATSITLDSGASATDDLFNNQRIYITGGPGVGQSRKILDYVGSTKVATVRAWLGSNPNNTSTFAILPEDSVWDDITADHLTSGSTGSSLNSAGSAGDPWGTALPGAYGAGTAGFILGTNLNATITSRMATYTQPTGFLAATFPGGTIANTTNITSASGVLLGNGAHGGVAATLTLERLVAASTTTNEPAFKLTGNGSGAGLDVNGGLTGAGIRGIGGATSGHGLYLEASSSNYSALALANNVGSGHSLHAFNKVTFDDTFVISNGITANITGNIIGTLSTLTTYTGNTPQTGDSFARIGAAGVGLTNLGDTRIANLDATVSSRLAAASYTAPDNATISIINTNVGTLLTRITATLFSGITSMAQWLGIIAGKQVGNSTARTEVRATGAGAGTFDETTDSQEAIRDRGDAAWTTGGTAPTAVQVADALLGRNIAGGSDGGRMVKDAFRASRNKVAFDVPTAGQFTVYAEDDATPAWTGSYTASPGANPVTVIDPA